MSTIRRTQPTVVAGTLIIYYLFYPYIFWTTMILSPWMLKKNNICHKEFHVFIQLCEFSPFYLRFKHLCWLNCWINLPEPPCLTDSLYKPWLITCYLDREGEAVRQWPSIGHPHGHIRPVTYCHSLNEDLNFIWNLSCELVLTKEDKVKSINIQSTLPLY